MNKIVGGAFTAMDSDFFLIRRMKGGDENAIELFVRKYYNDILEYCWRHIYHREDAQDAAQETFERFFKNFSGYVHQGKAKNYLYIIAGNVCKNYYRTADKLIREGIALAELRGSPEEIPDTSPWEADRVGLKLDICRALRLLPEDLREVIILYYFQGLKLKEISQILQPA